MNVTATLLSEVSTATGSDLGLLTRICDEWEQARQRNEDPSPEELCRDHPEMVGAVREAIGGLRKFNRAAGHNESLPPLPPGCRYRLVRFLAAGGLGQVFVAHDDELRREVAVKFVRPDRLSMEAAVRRFEWEADVTGRLEHPGIPPVFGLVRDSVTGTVAYAMRLLPGKTLQDVGDAWHRSPDRANLATLRGTLEHLVRVCRTIAFAHSRGLVHRDLKPSNVIAGPDGQTWVFDWGLAKAITPSGPATGLLDQTRAGEVLGTPAYMPPEQAAGELNAIGPAADVYTLGGILYFLLTGSPPHQGTTSAAVLTRALNADVQPARTLNPAVPAELEAICRRCMARAPTDRFASAEEVAIAIEQYLAGPPQPARRPRWLWLLWCVLALGAAVFVAVSLIHTTSSDGSVPGEANGSAAVPVAHPEIGATAPSAMKEPFRVKSLDVMHFAWVRAEDVYEPRGVLREDSGPQIGDGAQLVAKLTRPGYAYIIAFRPDGVADLCFPNDENTVPPLTDTPRYPDPPRNPKAEIDDCYGLREGTGLWVFAVVASERPLPTYRQWLAGQALNWKPVAASTGAVWWYDGAELTTRLRETNNPRGKDEKMKGPAATIRSLSRSLEQPDTTVGIIGFGVSQRN